MHKKLVALILGIAVSAHASGVGERYAIQLKSRTFLPDTLSPVRGASRNAVPAVGHRIVQFEAERFSEGVTALKASGIAVTGFVPQYAVSVFLVANQSLEGIQGIRWIGQLDAADRLSGRLSMLPGLQHVLIDGFRAEDRKAIVRKVLSLGGRVTEHSGVRPGTVLAEVQTSDLRFLAGAEEVSYIQPAPKVLLTGQPVHYCAGALTQAGPVATFALRGEGWDGGGANSIALTYHFLNGTPDIAGDGEHSEVVRALRTWSQHAQISWSETTLSNQSKSLDIRWTTSGFDGVGGTLAYAYFPSPPNQEPVAGDIFFDDAETWRVGSNIDMFTVALHEAGHALGLDHSDDPSAVMAPYYAGAVSGLTPDDIAGIQALYAPASSGPDIYEPDDTSATAKPIVSGSAQAHNIIPAMDQDWTWFTLTGIADVTVETSGSSGDTKMHLFDSALTLIDYDHDGGDEGFSRIVRSAALGNSLPAGKYYVLVEEYKNDVEILAYQLKLTVVYAGTSDPYEPDNTAMQAGWIMNGEPQVHSISPVGDVDYVKFSLSVTSDVIITVNGPNPTSDDTRMWLYGADVSTIEYNDDGGDGLYSKIDRRLVDGDPLAPGTYYVMIDEYGNNSAIASYTLSVDVTPLGGGDDAYEINNTIGTAWSPAFGWERNWLSTLHGVAVQSDFDFYGITVSPAGYERVQVDCRFRHLDGDIDIGLYNGSGALLASATSLTDNEFIDTVVTQAGNYFILVFGANAGNTYDLWWDDLPVPADGDDDAYEENDTRAEATPFVPPNQWLSTLSGKARQWDDDWYRIEVSSFDQRRIQIDCRFSHAEGDIDLTLLDANGNLLVVSWSKTDNEYIEYVTPATGIYYILVDYGNTGNIYDLRWNTLRSALPGKTADNDFDGDGRSDFGCYDPTTVAPGQWYFMTRQGHFSTLQFGAVGTFPITGDFDGDGLTDVGYFDPQGLGAPAGTWWLRQTSAGLKTFRFGYSGTIPVVGDFDGDGVDDYGCYDPNGIPGSAPPGSWYFMTSSNGFFNRSFGYPGTLPVVGDFDGDGVDDYGCYDPNGISGVVQAGSWYFMMSRKGFITRSFGYSGTIPVVGDFDGDHIDDYGCYDPTGITGIVHPGQWYFMKSTAGFDNHSVFGYPGTVPLVGDFDGDGIDDYGCYDAGGIPGVVLPGQWYFMMSRDGFGTYSFGYYGTLATGTR